MRRLVLPLLLLCCLPAAVSAAGIADLPLSCAPGVKAKEPPVFEPAKARPLTYEEQRDLRLLFAALEGSWHGSMAEQVCMVSGATKQHDYQATLTIRATHEGLELSGDYAQPAKHVRRRFNLRLFITPDGLRVDQRSRAGEVELLRVERRLLDYVRYYRSIHEAKVADPAADGQQAADTDNAVTGATNLTEQTSDAEPPPAKRYVVARAQRVILELPSSRELHLTRHFFVQGLYSGNMSWRLRRD